MNRCKHVWQKPKDDGIFKTCFRCKKRRKLFPKPKKKALKALCDKEWSRITKLIHIKKYGKICLWCRKPSDSLQSDHIINRWKHSTRWNISNCVILCAPDHLFRKKREPFAWAEMVRENVGQDVLDALELASREMIQPNYEEILSYLKKCEEEIICQPIEKTDQSPISPV